jgi:hypothetical protein
MEVGRIRAKGIPGFYAAFSLRFPLPFWENGEQDTTTI